MNKIIVLFFLIICVPETNAQFSLKGGISFAKQSYSTSLQTFETNRRIGYSLGLNYEFNISKSFSLKSGIEHSLKGSRIKNHVFSKNANLFYFDIPFEIHYHFRKISIFSGPYFGILSSAKIDSTDLNTKPFDIGINIDIDYIFLKYGLGFKYSRGFINVGTYTNEVFNHKNDVINIYLIRFFKT